MKNKVAVIGAGVSGITTAVMLQYFGFKVTIYSKKLPLSKPKIPEFGSLFPSASIIPHSVFHPQLDKIFQDSNSLFAELHNLNFPGLTIHDHFELFGFEDKVPEYATQISGFKNLADLNWMPTHPDIEFKTGYQFNCFFADWNRYFPALIELFVKNKGVFVEQTIDVNSLDQLSENIVINCAGLGAHQLDDEDEQPLILMGHLMKILETPSLLSPSGNTVSFNFTPGLEYYSDSHQTPLDVYCYPRKDDWILGGSRFRGTLDEEGNWVSDDVLSSTFPSQIEQLNTEIILNTFGLDVSNLKKREYLHSYRYVRNRIAGLRLEKDPSSNRLIIHNYGHGGAGVTLSWGCAYRVLNMIRQEESDQLLSLKEISGKLSNGKAKN